MPSPSSAPILVCLVSCLLGAPWNGANASEASDATRTLREASIATTEAAQNALLPRLDRIIRGSDTQAAAEAQLIEATWLRQRTSFAAADAKVEELRGHYQAPHETWARASLILAEIRRDQHRLHDAGLLAESVVQHGPEGPITFAAALLAGDIALDDNRPLDAEATWRWADNLAKRLWYAGAPAGIDADAAAQRLRDLAARRAAEGVTPEDAAFAAAERLRQAERWSEASKGYAAYQVAFPVGKHLHQATWAYGHCLLRNEQPTEARACWERFVAADPRGPWRGAALIGLVDLDLLQEGNLARAKALLAQGQAIITEHPPNSESDWWTAGRKLLIRSALLSWIEGDGATTRLTIDQARKFSGAGDQAMPTADANAPAIPGGLDRLAQVIASGRAILPPSVRSKSNAVTLVALAWAEVAIIDWKFPDAMWTYRRICENRMVATNNGVARAMPFVSMRMTDKIRSYFGMNGRMSLIKRWCRSE